MFHELVNHNDGIKKLLEKGYAISFDSSYLVIRDIPYLNDKHELKFGAILTKLDIIDKVKIDKPDDHQIFFAGGHPHNIDGTAIPNLSDRPAALTLVKKDVVVERQFSNKPPNGFSNFFDKIESYVTIICGPAMELYDVSPWTFQIDEDVVSDSVFKLHDTLTSRAEIGDLALRFKDDVIAIIGLGGTGSYVLDFLVKTPVKEIRAFDPDSFHIHNAFRSPGKLDETELGKKKGDVYQTRYDNFRRGLVSQPKFIRASSTDEIAGVTFAFVCVDKGSSRSGVFDLLIANKISFIDVGMGLHRKRGALDGMLRATYYSAETAAEIRNMQFAETSDDPDEEYRRNIQIAELNALNASLAVIRYKQLRSFYFDNNSFYHLLFGVGDFDIAGISTQ
jgi:hypothetical protein